MKTKCVAVSEGGREAGKKKRKREKFFLMLILSGERGQ